MYRQSEMSLVPSWLISWDLRAQIWRIGSKRWTDRYCPTVSDQMAVIPAEKDAIDRLLVVDDSEKDTQRLREMLEGLGFEIIPATNEEEVFKALAASLPDLVLVNLSMKGTDGFKLCQRIQDRAEWSDIPIIFISASEDKDEMVKALESGGVDYLAKPLKKPELLARLRTHLMLKTARDYARRLAQDKDELLGIISHYLQNHLAGMNMSALGLLHRTQSSDDPKLRLMAENIRTSTSQMRAFVRTFLANSAAEHGLPIKLEPVDICGAVVRALKDYEEAALLKSINIRKSLPESGIWVQADNMALAQVIDNIVSNAIKFSPPGKDIFIQVAKTGDKVECRIQDEGAGFTEEDKTRMFHRYARLSAVPTGNEPSTGLGLSIARKLVRAMNGELWCESQAGDGATFIIRLPGIAPRAGE
jgi:two-component system sensor histidine kinase/response regulator